jgi:positive regulator of sigma E activity
LTPKQTLYLALPLVVFVVLLLTYLRLFSSPVVIAILVVLYAAVSLRNRRKFARQGK